MLFRVQKIIIKNPTCNEKIIRTENQYFVSKNFSDFPSSVNCENSAFPENKYAIFNIFIILFVTGCPLRVSTINFKQNQPHFPHVTWNIWPASVPVYIGRVLVWLDTYAPKILCPTSHIGDEIRQTPSSRGQPSASLGPRLVFLLTWTAGPFWQSAALQRYHWHSYLFGIFLNGWRWKLWSGKNSSSTS